LEGIARARREFARLQSPLHAVVIGDGNDVEPPRQRRLHDRTRAAQPVAIGRVNVRIATAQLLLLLVHVRYTHSPGCGSGSSAAAGTPATPVAVRTARRMAAATRLTASAPRASGDAATSPVERAKTVSPS